jgi:hypothetical protein
MARSDDEKIADEKLCMRLLAGFCEDEKGRVVTSYLKPNSYEEQQARAALARVVRDSMRGFVGELLALAIDPRTPSATPGMWPTRRIRFESPARGRASTWARDLLIVHFIREELRKSPTGKEEAALAAASAHFGIRRSRAHAIWKTWKRLVKW